MHLIPPLLLLGGINFVFKKKNNKLKISTKNGSFTKNQKKTDIARVSNSSRSSFLHLGSSNAGPVLLIVWCLILTAFVIFRSAILELLLALTTIALIIVIILNVRIYVVTTSLIRFLAILALIFGGAGLMIRENSN